MSLTSHLNNPTSPIGQFIREHFSHTSGMTKQANGQLRSTRTLRPEDPSCPYSTLGMAIDYRLRYSFAITPYQQLVAWHGAAELTVKAWESDDDIPFDWNDLPRGMGIPTPVDGDGLVLELAQGPYPLKLILSFFNSLDTALLTIQPVGRRVEPEAERLLDRYCFVLALFEEVFRSDRYKDGPLLVPTPKQSVEELLSIPNDAWIDDLCAMSNLFYEHNSDLLSQSHILNPTFAGSGDVGGADADMIVDQCLLEVKASVQPQIRPDWLRQLAGYLLLDYDNIYQINKVGIYMARQGILSQWYTEEFLRELTGDPFASIATLRHEFQARFAHPRKRKRT
jgi:hypothetical protein